MKSFKQPLMKLSITQGRILVRLIYRETNNSAFAHIKEYKGSVNAYFWQSLALLFGNNLKADYEPYGKDREIEDIVKRIERGELQNFYTQRANKEEKEQKGQKEIRNSLLFRIREVHVSVVGSTLKGYISIMPYVATKVSFIECCSDDKCPK